MYSVFIDGAEGTTGLQIHKRLKDRNDIVLLEIPSDKRKDPVTRREFLNRADIVILCLPDSTARETAGMVENPKTRIIDASTAHRTDPAWVYGLPEMTKSQRGIIRSASRVSNPGCYATGFILLARPLAEKGIISPETPLCCFAVSGYSGGGKKMIAAYEANGERSTSILGARNYALSLNHKHLPEMQKYSLLSQPPIFLPVVGNYYNGMNVLIPLHISLLALKISPADIHSLYEEYYSGEPFICVKPLDTELSLEEGFLNAVRCNGTNRCDVFVFGSESRIVVAARLDNLGKGASGAAVQNMNIMMGIDEKTGLDG